MAKLTAAALATILSIAMLTRPALGNDTKTCCHIDGRCVVVTVYSMCPAGFF